MARTKYVDVRSSQSYYTRNAYIKEYLADKKVKLLDVGNLGDGKLIVDLPTMVKITVVNITVWTVTKI